jgi:hypothetical protein
VNGVTTQPEKAKRFLSRATAAFHFQNRTKEKYPFIFIFTVISFFIEVKEKWEKDCSLGNVPLILVGRSDKQQFKKQ